MSARDLIQGIPFGDVYPAQEAFEFPERDGKQAALRVLALYLSELTFRRPGNVGKPGIKLRVPLERIVVEQTARPTEMPSIVILGEDEGDYLAVGLSTFLEESSRDVHGKGTVLQVQSEYQEKVVVEVWASTKAERTGIMSGIESALVPTEQMYGIRFRVPEYFGQTACFTLLKSRRPASPDNSSGIWWGSFDVEVRFDVVRLVRYVEVKPTFSLEVDDGSVDLDP